MAQDKIDVSTLSEQDLDSRIIESQLRLKKLKFSHSVSPVENPMAIRALRREIARFKTELRKRELEGQNTKEN